MSEATTTGNGSPSLPSYAVRLTQRAQQDAAGELWRIEENQGEYIGRQWYIGLLAAAGTLAQQPYRNTVLDDESRWTRKETRRLLYRRTPSSAAYLLYYTVEEGGEDGPCVRVFHIRHGAARPLGSKEARQMRSEM